MNAGKLLQQYQRLVNIRIAQPAYQNAQLRKFAGHGVKHVRPGIRQHRPRMPGPRRLKHERQTAPLAEVVQIQRPAVHGMQVLHGRRNRHPAKTPFVNRLSGLVPPIVAAGVNPGNANHPTRKQAHSLAHKTRRHLAPQIARRKTPHKTYVHLEHRRHMLGHVFHRTAAALVPRRRQPRMRRILPDVGVAIDYHDKNLLIPRP